MRLFDEQLLRLKQTLSLTADQDVAAALGMTKAAFSDRKKRGAFPEDRLFATAAKLGVPIDIHYILTGESAAFVANLAAVRESTRNSGGDVARRDALAQELMDLRPTPQEATLLGNFRRCSQEDQAVLRRMAESLAAPLGATESAPRYTHKPTK